MKTNALFERIARNLGVYTEAATVYRYGSKPGRVLTLVSPLDAPLGPPVHVDNEHSGSCAGHAC